MFERIAILAPGLLGASVALAAKAFGQTGSVAVWARRPETRLQIAELPWCDDVYDRPAAAVEGAGLVVVCAPVESIVPLVRDCAPGLSPGALVTDVGSVKSLICRQAQGAVPDRAIFIGSHPMAGSEKTGHEHGSEKLFENRTCFVTPTVDADPSAVESLARFWHGLGARVATATPEEHDEIVANVSHLPHALAAMLCVHLSERPAKWKAMAGNGLRDTTRIASGSPDLWREIFSQNREEVLRALSGLDAQLQLLRSALANGDDWAVRDLLARAKAHRDSLTF